MDEPMNSISRLLQRRESVRNRQEGIALITTLLILLLLSTMIVGLAWLVLGDQKLGGNNNDRQLAFYGAEAGMETMTASLENLFDANYAPDKTAINNLMTVPGPPTNIPGVLYLAPGNTTNGSGYTITFTPSTTNANLPASGFGTIPSGNYAGLVGLMTPYTLSVTAHTTGGSEVKLQRQVQTVGIPVFQFGFFSQTDLDFFAGPTFNFGGRVHTNGNLWLAEGGGNTLTLSQKVTAVGEIITSNLENGFLTNAAYPGAINITTGSGVQNLLGQSPQQSVLGAASNFVAVGAYDTNFGPMASSIYNGDIAVGSPNGPVKPLNLAIATPAIGGQSIDLIRRPVQGEAAAATASKLAERYWSQVSFRILLSDYDSNGKCTNSDISSGAGANALPELSANLAAPVVTPIDLATLAWTGTGPPAANANGTLPFAAPPAWLTAANIGHTVFPLPTSGATGGATYAPADGYWVKQYYPIITGCIKIDYQTTAGGAWTDVTPAILNLGYTGRDINPQGNVGFVASPLQPSQPGAQVGGQGAGPTVLGGLSPAGLTCADPSPLAVIRFARVRDNPSWAAPSGGCAAPPSAVASQLGTDYWPNVLFDTREGLLRDTNVASNANSPNGSLTLNGAMYYVELDVANLATWLSANAGSVNNTTGYSVYFSDRRGEQPDPNPPASVSATQALTGGSGYEDIVNSNNGTSTANGCPNGTLDQGEDQEGDFNSAGVDPAPLALPRTYGNVLAATPASLWPIANTGTQLGAPGTLLAAVLVANPSCAGPGIKWPFATVNDPWDLRENPPIFFRRALKIVDGTTITLGTCNSVPCGLTIVSENPVYLQGDYNNPGLSTTFANPAVGAAIIADAVTLLSDNWNDVNSFAFPYLNTLNGRVAHDTTYRVAVAAGKGIPFINPTGYYQDFGTDGGAHNFLRFMEDWGASKPNGKLYYQGSIVSMYYNHQAVGTYKCCTTVYQPPGRAYQFDTNFLTPSLLPPLTPMLRTVNTIGFTQMILPTQ
jgi:PilX N-terminal